MLSQKRVGSNILIANAELLKSIINTLATPIFIKDQHHKWILVNDSFCEFMGKSREELIGRSDYDFFPKEEADVFREKDIEVFATRNVNINVENFTDSHHQTHIIETKKMVFHNSEWGDVLCGVITDITQLKQYQNELNELNAHLQKQVSQRTEELQKANRKLEKMAYVDKLTGLMNRSAIDALFQDYVNQSKQGQLSFALLYLDIDDLKRINDSYGHPEGDAIIKAFALILDQLFSDKGCVARIGGDEFVILYRYSSKKEVQGRIKKLVQQLQQPISLHNRKLFISSSIGVTFCPEDSNDRVTLTSYADAAMYQAKKHNKGSFVLHEDRFIKATRRELEIEQELRNAVEEDRIRVNFQPIYSMHQDQIIGYEALARWHCDPFGEVSPNEFIPIAEKSDLILTLGQQVLKRAAEFIKQHCEPNQYVSVNVSPIQLMRGDLKQQAKSIIESSRIDPSQLALEVTESVMMRLNTSLNDFKTCPTLQEVRFFVDDFGSGYSNLSQLKKLEFSALKIDQEFIRDLPHSPMDQSLVSTMISMANELNLKIIAEGVETEQQKNCLLDMGCEIMQGFLISKPQAYD